ncbi:MAG: 4-(cytidine 5'-diphospho)-2-C-methyl-D-erythritol kinase [Zavarzinella sp.]
MVRTAAPFADRHLIRSGTGTITIWSPAKLNLFFEILGKRADGYHEVETLMVPIDLYDTLTFEHITDCQIILACNIPELPTDEKNLINKAARLLLPHAMRVPGVKINHNKKIPWAAGLGGGSGNAACTLIALNILWECNLGKSELYHFACQLGSDVPFFLQNTPAWCTGRGEIITPTWCDSGYDFVILKPNEGLSTAAVFQHLTIPRNPLSPASMKEAFASGDLHSIGWLLHNRLQEPSFELSPAVAAWYQRMSHHQSAGVLMSGSGSSLFALCRSSLEASRIKDDLTRGIATTGDRNTRVFHVRSLH